MEAMVGSACREYLRKKLYNASLPVLFSLVFMALPVSLADAFQAKLMPARIQQGDAFLISVSGLKRTEKPSAVVDDKQVIFSSLGKGRFIAIEAMDIQSKPGLYRIPLAVGKRKIMLRLRVLEGRFDTVHLTLPEEKVSPYPEDLHRISREAELLNSIWQIASERLWKGSFELPLQGPLSTPFGTKRIINQETVSLHRGLDIKGEAGEYIRASNRGRVVLTEELFFGGNTVIVDHGQGIFTVYMHLSGFNVIPGDLVSKNDILGFVGSTGRSSGPHLHFGVKVNGINTNPVSLTGLKL